MSSEAIAGKPEVPVQPFLRMETLRAFFGGRLTAKGVFERLARVVSDFSVLRLPGVRVYWANHPDLIQECLVTRHRDFHKDKYYNFLSLVLGNGLLSSEDDFHLRQRRMIQPAFHKERIHAYGETMAAYATRAADAWQDGQQVDMMAEMNRLTLAIVGKTLFNSDVTADAAIISHSIDEFLKRDGLYMAPGGHLLFKLPVPYFKKFHKAVADIDAVMYRIIDEHRASGDQGDLLSMLLDAQDDDDKTSMTARQVRDEAITLFLAGHETTALALTWAWYSYSQHPEVVAKLQAELDSVLGDRPPSAGDYPRLVYTRQFISEVMRLYPPAYMIGRQAVCDTEVGGVSVPKGSYVMLAPYFMQRHPRYWPDPERFDPERFGEASAAARPKFAYFPFGGGRRLCIGEPFAWMELVLVFAALAQRWTASLDPKHAVNFTPKVTLRPKGGMPMTLHRRR